MERERDLLILSFVSARERHSIIFLSVCTTKARRTSGARNPQIAHSRQRSAEETEARLTAHHMVEAEAGLMVGLRLRGEPPTMTSIQLRVKGSACISEEDCGYSSGNTHTHFCVSSFDSSG